MFVCHDEFHLMDLNCGHDDIVVGSTYIILSYLILYTRSFMQSVTEVEDLFVIYFKSFK